MTGICAFLIQASDHLRPALFLFVVANEPDLTGEISVALAVEALITACVEHAEAVWLNLDVVHLRPQTLHHPLVSAQDSR